MDGRTELPTVNRIKPLKRNVNPEDRNLIIGIVAVVLIIAGGYAALNAYSGLSTPFSVVMSESMQHDPDRSQIGCIDTGDVVVVKSVVEDEVQSYVKGTVTGHKTFGDYGSVIIYERNLNQNPVIHRAIVWLDWDGEKWSSPELQGYAGKWHCISGGKVSTDPYNLTGILYFEDITVSGKTVSVNLNNLSKNSGFLTLGDNPEGNTNFDQTTGIANGPIPMEKIRSIPFMEIPWIGSIKVAMKGDNMEHAPNSIPSLVMTLLTVISIIIVFDILNHKHTRDEAEKERKRYRF